MITGTNTQRVSCAGNNNGLLSGAIGNVTDRNKT